MTGDYIVVEGEKEMDTYEKTNFTFFFSSLPINLSVSNDFFGKIQSLNL